MALRDFGTVGQAPVPGNPFPDVRLSEDSGSGSPATGAGFQFAFAETTAMATFRMPGTVQPGTSPSGSHDLMWLVPAGAVLTAFVIGYALGQYRAAGDATALWTAVLCVLTIVSVFVSVCYQRTIHEQLEVQKTQFEVQRKQSELQEAQFQVYLRPLLVWDRCRSIAGGREVFVRNVGRTTALIRAGSPTLVCDGELVPVTRETGWVVITQDRLVCPRCAVYVATLPDGVRGTVSVPYLDSPASGFEDKLSDLVTDMLASCHRQGTDSDL